MLTQIADGVEVAQIELLLNNTVVVQGPSGVLVVDAGITGAEMLALADDLRSSGRAVVAGFATHPDWDHVLWHPALGDAPRYATAVAADDMRVLRARSDWTATVVEGLPPEIAGDVPLEPFGLLTGLAPGAVRLEWDGPEVRIIEHRAHARGHGALVVEESRVLIAGDMLSDLFVPMLDLAADDPVGDYLAALDRFDEVADAVDTVVPGHGSVGSGDEVRERIERDRDYLRALREGREPDDARTTGSTHPGFEWVGAIHEGQVEGLRRRARPA